MGRRNPLEKALDHITGDFRKRLTSVRSSNAVPLGEEEITPKELVAKFPDMRKAQRKELLSRLGQEEVIRLLRDGS